MRVSRARDQRLFLVNLRREARANGETKATIRRLFAGWFARFRD